MKYRVDKNIEEEICELIKANEMVAESLKNTEGIIEILKSGVWTGKSNDTAVTLMEIFKEYHNKLLELDNEHLELLKQLDDNATTYMMNGNIPVI